MVTCGSLLLVVVVGGVLLLLALASFFAGVLDATQLPPPHDGYWYDGYAGYGYDGYDGMPDDMGGWVLMDEEDFGDWW